VSEGYPQISVRASIAPGGGWIVPAVNTNLGYLTRIHGGIFSRAEALDCGENDRTLAEARRAGVIVRLRRGMYAPADIYQACDDSGKHLLHARAALAAQKGPRSPVLRQQRCMDLRFISRTCRSCISCGLTRERPDVRR